VLSIPIVHWSPIGRQVLGLGVTALFGVGDDIFQPILSLPVVFYSARIFSEGAVRALLQWTLDLMVLVAVARGTGWLYSVVTTLAGGGDVFFCEAASLLATFVLLGHRFEMRARGGANDAIRTLLDPRPRRPLSFVMASRSRSQPPNSWSGSRARKFGLRSTPAWPAGTVTGRRRRSAWRFSSIRS
jgi:Cu2+-exporting ATPase